MSAGSSSSVGNVALIASGTGGIVAAINEYAVVIGLTLTLISVIIGLVFHIRADIWRRQESERFREELKRQIIADLAQERATSLP